MWTLGIRVQKEFCGECSLALLHFLRKIPGIESIEFDIGSIMVTYDNMVLRENQVLGILKESIGKMGYHLQDEETSL